MKLPRLKKLHLLMIRTFAGPFVAGFSVALFILVLQFIAREKDNIFGKGFSMDVLAQLVGYVALALMVPALALGILLSSLMAMGKLGENYELAALKSSGISLLRVMRPMLFIGAFICGLAFLISFYATPWANLKLYSLFYDLKQAKPTFAMQPGMFNSLIDGYTLRMGSRNPKSGRMYDVIILDHQNQLGLQKTIAADSADMDIDNTTFYLRMRLYKGRQIEKTLPNGTQAGQLTVSVVEFDTLIYPLDLSGWGLRRTDEHLFTSHHYMLSVHELDHVIDSLRQANQRQYLDVKNMMEPILHTERLLSDSVQTRVVPRVAAVPDTVRRLLAKPSAVMLEAVANNMRGIKSQLGFSKELRRQNLERLWSVNTEYHLRYTMPLASLLFLVIGTSLGAIIRKGGLGMPVLMSLVFFIFFYLLMTYGKKLSQEGVWPSWMAVWLPIYVMLPMAIYLAYQSATDSALFDLSAWKLLWERTKARFAGNRATA